nr:2Fe-2S iron-sulfur cluster-binding protein [Nonomuraea aridisoli]
MSLIKEKDHGTPARSGEATVSVEIDGRTVLVPEGTSVMRAAAECGIDIPKLCATDTLEPFGSCRLCLVEVDGRKGSPASYTTPVAEGMKVRTQTPKLAELRRGVMELYISDHPLDCLTCPANGDCELQDMSGVVGLREVRYGFDGENHLDLPTNSSNPCFDFDASKCIACSRCVRACGEIQGTFALTIEGLGVRLEGRRRRRRHVHGVRLRVLRRLSAGMPDVHAAGAVGGRAGHAQPQRAHHLRLLRRGLLVQGRAARRRGRPHGAPQGRQGQRRPLLREGPLRLRLRLPPRPAAQADAD